jgi:hypothetical protein
MKFQISDLCFSENNNISCSHYVSYNGIQLGLVPSEKIIQYCINHKIPIPEHFNQKKNMTH